MGQEGVFTDHFYIIRSKNLKENIQIFAFIQIEGTFIPGTFFFLTANKSFKNSSRVFQKHL